MKLLYFIGKICLSVLICITTMPCVANTATPLFLGLPFFFQSAFFVDTCYQITALFNEIKLQTCAELFLSFFIGLLLVTITIGIEYRSIRKTMGLEHDKRLLKAVGIGNIVSTLVGIPVSLLFLTRTGIEFQSFGPIALFPPVNSIWTIIGLYTPLMFAIGFILTYLIEKPYIIHVVKTDNPATLKKAIWFANIKGYAYPLLAILFALIIGLGVFNT